jgi:tetratricopeptide (TPR) repeat protein
VEPHHPMTHFTCAKVHNMDGKFDTALDALRRAHEVYSGDHLLRWIYAQTLFYNRLNDEACSVADKLIKDAPDDLLARISYSVALTVRRRKTEALDILQDPKVETWARHDFGCSFFVAESYAVLDHRDEAMDWLENAFHLGFLNYPFLNEYNPLLKNIRADERFRKLMDQVKQAWKNFKV